MGFAQGVSQRFGQPLVAARLRWGLGAQLCAHAEAPRVGFRGAEAQVPPAPPRVSGEYRQGVGFTGGEGAPCGGHCCHLAKMEAHGPVGGEWGSGPTRTSVNAGPA